MNFIELIQNEEYRIFVANRIKDHLKNSEYCFPNKIPSLFKYRAFSQHTVDDLLNKRLTLTSVGNFNDLFDSTIHSNGTAKDIKDIAEQKTKEFEKQFECVGIENIIKHDEWVKLETYRLTQESRLNFRKLDYLSTKASCFSKRNDSILMWSHYSSENTGICIEYDFNELKNKGWIYSALFPVAYSNEPIDLSDLLDQGEQSNDSYQLEKAILCATLCKSKEWEYEHEWRLFWPPVFHDDDYKYLPINININPKRVYLGYHFLKNFFYINNTQDEINMAEDKIKLFIKMLYFLDKEKIPVSIMLPHIGLYKLSFKNLSTKKLMNFMIEQFPEYSSEQMKYYYVCQDCLMDILNE